MRVNRNDLYERIADRDKRFVEIGLRFHHSSRSQQATVGGADHPLLDGVAYGHSGEILVKEVVVARHRSPQPSSLTGFLSHRRDPSFSSKPAQSLSFTVKDRFRSSHFDARQMESEGGFCALILVYPVLMQRISTTTRARIVERQTEIVPIEKPVETAAGRPVPAGIPSQRIGFHAGGNHGMGFHRLLIETGSLLAPDPESIAANRREMATFGLLVLH